MIRNNLSQGLGRRAENLAVELLRRANYQIINRNYRRKTGEIDIIAQPPTTGKKRQSREIVFIEVKYRGHRDYGGSILALTFRQQQRIRRTATLWLQQHAPNDNCQCRFDVIGFDDLTAPDSSNNFHWIEGAF